VPTKPAKWTVSSDRGCSGSRPPRPPAAAILAHGPLRATRRRGPSGRMSAVDGEWGDGIPGDGEEKLVIPGDDHCGAGVREALAGPGPLDRPDRRTRRRRAQPASQDHHCGGPTEGSPHPAGPPRPNNRRASCVWHWRAGCAAPRQPACVPARRSGPAWGRLASARGRGGAPKWLRSGARSRG